MAAFSLALFLLIICGAAQAQIEPQNVVVLAGSTARFNCSTTAAQPIMAWLLNGVLVISVQPTSWTSSNPRFSATNYTTPGRYKWEFIINNVERSDAGQVTCQYLGLEAQASSLSVQQRGSVSIIGGNRTVSQGLQTVFQCQANGWFPEPSVYWSVNGVVGQYCTNSSVVQGNVFNTNCSLTMTVARNSSVQCLAKVSTMSSPDSSTVFVTAGRNQTILIAVTVAFSAAALLFLIIFGIIFFCRRRKKDKSGYQEEVRRSRLHSQHMTTVTSHARGHDNKGYATDGRYGRDYNGGVWHTNYSPKQQQSYPRDDFFDDGYRHHRHMTTV